MRECAQVEEINKRICVSWSSQTTWTPRFRLSPDIDVIQYVQVAWDHNRKWSLVQHTRTSNGFKIDLRGVVPPEVTITRFSVGLGSYAEFSRDRPALKTPSATISAPPRRPQPGKPTRPTAAEISASLGFPVRGVRSRR